MTLVGRNIPLSEYMKKHLKKKHPHGRIPIRVYICNGCGKDIDGSPEYSIGVASYLCTRHYCSPRCLKRGFEKIIDELE